MVSAVSSCSTLDDQVSLWKRNFLIVIVLFSKCQNLNVSHETYPQYIHILNARLWTVTISMSECVMLCVRCFCKTSQEWTVAATEMKCNSDVRSTGKSSRIVIERIIYGKKTSINMSHHNRRLQTPSSIAITTIIAAGLSIEHHRAAALNLEFYQFQGASSQLHLLQMGCRAITSNQFLQHWKEYWSCSKTRIYLIK